MSEHPEHGPSHREQVNPKVASDIAYWSKEFGVDGQTLHEAIRVHGVHVDKLRKALKADPGMEGAQHQKKGVED